MMKDLADIYLIREMEFLHKFVNRHNATYIWGNGVIGKALYQLKLCSNGILLSEKKTDLWEACAENRIEIWVTPYPANIDYKRIEKTAKEYQVPLFYAVDFFSQDIEIKTSCCFPMSADGNQERMNCIFCNGYQDWITLYRGKLYNCSTIYPAKYLNSRFGMDFKCEEEKDSIDIYRVESWKELAEFERSVPQFCKYCKVSERKDGYPWKQSGQRKEEWIL